MTPSQLFGIAKALFKGYRYSGRAWKSPEYLGTLQNNTLQKTVSIAYNQTEFYRKKYDAHGVHPRDIKTIEDLPKLPIITKKELIENTEDTAPRSLDKKKSITMGTSGSTGQPILIYKDYEWLAHFIGFTIRMIKLHKMGIPKFSYIADINSENSMEKKMKGFFGVFSSLKGTLIDVNQDIETIMASLEEGNVEYVATYTTVMRELAVLKKNGMGKKLNLKMVGLTGEILDDYTRNLVEEAFGCKCYSAYISTEGGATAIECEKKKMHINSDSVIVEIVDQEGNIVPAGEDGNILLTCCDGGYSTPIIRYSGCADVGQLLDEKCSCGLNTPIMGPVKGRIVDSVLLPDGRKFHSFSMTIPMEKIQRSHGKDRVRQYQIVQHQLNEISISLVRNKEKAMPDDSLADIMDIIRKTYQDIFGKETNLIVQEVESLPRNDNQGMPTPLVVSKIDNKDKDKLNTKTMAA